jgi:hypothetical protein
MLGTAMFLILLRAFLPTIFKWYLVREFNAIEGYSAKIDDVDIYLYRLGFSIDGFVIYETKTGDKKPLFSCEKWDISVQFSKIIQGKIVGKMTMERPELNFVVGIEEKQVPDSSYLNRFQRNNFNNAEKISWQQEIKDIIPIRINKIEVIDGKISYKDEQMSSLMNFTMTNVNGELRNLTNVDNKKRRNYAEGKLEGKIMKSGKFKGEIHLNPLSERGDYDVNIQVYNIYLPEFNNAFTEYAGIDAENGSFNCTFESVCEDGKVHGYLKPILKKPKFFSLKSDLKKPLHQGAWNALAGLLTGLHKNPFKNQIATKIDFQGDAGKLNYNPARIYLYILKNAFFKAFNNNIENSINLNKA